MAELTHNVLIASKGPDARSQNRQLGSRTNQMGSPLLSSPKMVPQVVRLGDQCIFARTPTPSGVHDIELL